MAQGDMIANERRSRPKVRSYLITMHKGKISGLRNTLHSTFHQSVEVLTDGHFVSPERDLSKGTCSQYSGPPHSDGGGGPKS